MAVCFRLSAVLCLLACLAACAPQTQLPRYEVGRVGTEARKQQELTVQDFMAKAMRLERVSWAVRARNAELCGDKTVFRPGLKVADLSEYTGGERELMASALGLGDRPKIHALIPGGPAQGAGLQAGDVILAAQGAPVANKQQFNQALAPALASGAAISLTVERGGATQEATFTPSRLCAFEPVLRRDNSVNAFANGALIVVNTGMLKFVESDDELAAIIGHEMAHNSQGHLQAKRNNALAGALLIDLPIAILTGINPNVGGSLGQGLYSQEFESEADYVGLYFTARAGYDIHNVPNIWRRMALENPGAITMGSSHPSTSERFVALEAAAAEIDAKRAAGAELRPEMKAAKQ